ncbi:MAG: AraC family transcriptional regulator [Saprospiraceae bacterium]|nr:MAG: AraC family transcriptional regulator [Saprospiraceae bacterium]
MYFTAKTVNLDATLLGKIVKHLIRTFDKTIGIKPKMLARIFKFQKAIQTLEQRQTIRWTDLSDDCGYFDQAHFIKEFQLFSGINPSRYFDVRGDIVN